MLSGQRFVWASPSFSTSGEHTHANLPSAYCFQFIRDVLRWTSSGLAQLLRSGELLPPALPTPLAAAAGATTPDIGSRAIVFPCAFTPPFTPRTDDRVVLSRDIGVF